MSEKPRLNTNLLFKGDKDLVDVIKQIDTHLGTARQLPDTSGTMRDIRIGDNGIEVLKNGKWISLATAQKDSSTSDSGLSGQLIVVPVVLSKSLRVDGSIGFYGTVPVGKTAVATVIATIGTPLAVTGNTDGEVQALTFSNPPTQAECEALRDKVEELADDVRGINAGAASKADVESVRAKLGELIAALQATGII